MGQIVSHAPVLCVVAAFSRHDDALDWAQTKLIAELGHVALASERFEHEETAFYTPTMGAGLRKMFFAFEQLIDPASLVHLKIQSNAWEEQCQATGAWLEQRPLNLDPGYLTEAKFVLATTKDRDHRLYLDRGIFAECTLYYHRGAWQPRPWTYPDYLRSDYHRFFLRCREYLRQRYRSSPTVVPLS